MTNLITKLSEVEPEEIIWIEADRRTVPSDQDLLADLEMSLEEYR